MVIPEGYYGQFEGRSGLAYKNGIHVLGGVIDSNYRGELKVIVTNTGSEAIRVQKGDRIAQMVTIACVDPSTYGIISREDADETNRGEAGFGSSGS